MRSAYGSNITTRTASYNYNIVAHFNTILCCESKVFFVRIKRDMLQLLLGILARCHPERELIKFSITNMKA